MKDRVRVEVNGALATVHLTRGDKHNGMDLEMLRQVNAAARRLKHERSIRAVVICGDGPSFCAGLDFKAVLGRPLEAAASYARLWSPRRNDFQRCSLLWREVPVPVIASIHGNCFGAGLQLALGADLRVATPDAQLSVMEVKWGLVPDMGGTVLLRELVSIDKAKELVMTGRIVSGREAQAMGLVTHVSETPIERAREIVEEIETRSPDAVAAAKMLLQEAWLGSAAEALAAERRWQRALLGGKNQRISLQRNLKKKLVPFAPRTIAG